MRSSPITKEEVLKYVSPDLWRVVQNAAKLPSEFVLDLDFEDIELVEKGSARPLIPVTALSSTWLIPFHGLRGSDADRVSMVQRRKLGGSGSRWTSSRHACYSPAQNPACVHKFAQVWNEPLLPVNRWWMRCMLRARMSVSKGSLRT